MCSNNRPELTPRQLIKQELDACQEYITNAPNRDAAFNALLKDIHTAMANTWDEAVRTGYKTLLNKLYNGKITTGAQAAEVLGDTLSKQLAGDLEKPLKEWTTATYKLGHDEVGGQLKTSISFNVKDQEALKILNSQNLFWIGEYYDENTKSAVANAMNELLAQGANRDKVADDMAKVLGDETGKGRRYFYDFAEHTANRLRNMGAVQAMRKSSAVSAEVVAILDDRTTDICANMNGRILPITTLVQVVDDLLAIKTEGRTAAEVKDDLKAIVPFWNDKDTADIANMSTEELMGRFPGLSLPPYHWLCRTRIFVLIQEEVENIPDIDLTTSKNVDKATKERISNLSKVELYNKVKPVLSSEQLRFNPKDLNSDMSKHAKKEFGLTKESDYIALANAARKNPDHILAKNYNGQLQFTMFNTKQNAMVVVGENGVIRGCYQHKGKQAIDKAAAGIRKQRVEISVKENK